MRLPAVADVDLGALPLVGLAAAVLLGAGTQRITGLGFALVASPFLVLVLGAFTGVLVVNLLGSVTSALVLLQVRRDVDVRRALLLAGPAVLAVVPGAWVARQASPAALQVVVGACVVLALLTVLAVTRRAAAQDAHPAGAPAARRRRTGAVVAGAASGLMNVTAGVGGPAITVYAVAVRWQQRSFAATAQLYFTIVGVASLTAKGGLPSLSWPAWTTAAVALAAGLALGSALHARVPPAAARTAAVLLALVGGTATLVEGLLGL